jgi:predicted protein tyrosine phosphatase
MEPAPGSSATSGTLIVSPLSRVSELCASHRPSHILSLLSPNSPARSLDGLAGRGIRLDMHDVIEFAEGCVAPNEELMRTMLAFAGAWDGTRPMLVHCWAGISRSTAAAFIFACERSPETSETDIAAALRNASPFATPNRLMVALADGILSRGGRMVKAIEQIGRGADAFEGVPFEFAARRSNATIET